MNSLKHFEQAQGLDTVLYKNVPLPLVYNLAFVI